MSSAEERLLSLLQQISVEQRPCRRCGRPLYFVRLKSGKLAPYTGEGVDHFVDCPYADTFRRPTPQRQERLFEPPAEAAFDPK